MCLVTQWCPALCNPLDYSPSGSSVHGIDSPSKNTGVSWHFLLQGNLPDPGIKVTSSVSPALQADSLPAEPSGKPYIMHKMLLIKWLVKFDSYFIFNKHMLKYKTLRSLLEMRETFMSFKL